MKTLLKTLVSSMILIMVVSQTAFGQWHTLSSGMTEDCRVIKFINSNTGFIGGASQIRRTTDAGNHWQSIVSCLDSADSQINSFAFSDEQTGYVACNNTIRRTTDAGSTWTVVHHYAPIINSIQTYPDMAIDESGHGAYVLFTTVTGYYSYQGQLVHIQANGIETPTQATLLNPYGENVIGRSISRQANGSYRVHAIEVPWIVMHNARRSCILTFIGVSQKDASGYNGEMRCLFGDRFILHQWHNIYPSSEMNSLTTIGNPQPESVFYLHWDQSVINGHPLGDSTYGYNYFPNAISGTHNDRIYFVGSFSRDRDNVQPSTIKYYRVSDGSIQNDNSYSSTTTLQCLTETENAIYAGGEGGLLIKLPLSYIPSGIVTENTQAGDIRLGNYPNPFNPLTNIEYTLPRDGFVSIQIFDSMGREIRQLVSGRETAGTHTVLFDASLLSSGTYYCRLEYNGSIKTKAIVLIK